MGNSNESVMSAFVSGTQALVHDIIRDAHFANNLGA